VSFKIIKVDSKVAPVNAMKQYGEVEQDSFPWNCHLLYQSLMTDEYGALVEQQQWITKICLTLVTSTEMSALYTVFNAELKNHVTF
jgi:hypothetical protein